LYRMILACAARDVTQAKRFGLPIAQIAYQIAADGTLHRASAAEKADGGFLFLTAEEQIITQKNHLAQLSQAIVEECRRQNFSAVLLAMFKSHPFFHHLVQLLSAELKALGIGLYLPETYAESGEWAQIIIPTAIWAGSLQQKLEKAIAAYGKERICLDIERLRLDFSLGSQAEHGEKLSAQSLYEKRKQHQPNSYFSQDLQAYYFSYEDKSGTHFVLYDDTYSIGEKLLLAQQLGITESIVLYPEVADILPGLVAKLSGLMQKNGG